VRLLFLCLLFLALSWCSMFAMFWHLRCVSL
jgi:hypothetical protein